MNQQWDDCCHPYRQHLIGSGLLVPDQLTPCGVWLDTAPCLHLTHVERAWFTKEAMEWLAWWELATPEVKNRWLEEVWL